jgi:hypothetical protein
LPFFTVPSEYAVLAFDNWHREVFQIQFLTAANGRQPRLVDAAAQREIHGGSGADDLGPERLAMNGMSPV